jgi:pimeloyl-ACP methyl ester carboxylesterase
MHGSYAQRLERTRVHAGEVGALAQPVDGAVHFVRDARLFFIQCHMSVAAAKGCFLNPTVNTVVFSHGKESGPWGGKILRMAAVARDLNLAVESVDYRGMDDPGRRVEKLVQIGGELKGPLLLVGSSMGGHVSAAAAARLAPRALFLLAPAFYMPGFEEYTPQDVAAPTAIVHGWRDDVVPVENSMRWAREHRATLHVLDSDHRLEDRIGPICVLLRAFLASLMGAA